MARKAKTTRSLQKSSSAPTSPKAQTARPPISDQVLNDWVYAERRLLGTLDVPLLEHHAEAQLARALNSRRLIAVIGSGVSNAYGQPSWGELLNDTIDAIWEALREEISNSAFPKTATHDARREAILVELRVKDPELAVAAEALRDGGDDWTVDTIPFLFELCENILVALHRSKLPSEQVNLRSESRKARAAMRSRLRWQIKDARGRIAILLTKILDAQSSARLGTTCSKLKELRETTARTAARP